MDTILFFGFMILAFILIPIGIGFLIFWIPKRLGYPKVGKALALLYSLSLLIFVSLFIFEDYLFTKDDAKELLSEHNIELDKSFKITRNKSGGFKDYSHEFTLEISNADKNKIIKQHTEASNYLESLQSDNFDFRVDKTRYSEIDTSYTTRYQNSKYYIYEYYKPNKKGIKPT